MKNNYSNIFFILFALLPAQITFSQNVGIGTTTPADKLHVFGGQVTIEGSSFPWLSFRNNNALKGFIGVNNNDLRIGTWNGNTTGHVALVTNNVERMRIMSDGDVGIGVTSPQSLLHIANPSGPTQFTIGTNYTSGGNTALYMGTSALTNGYGYLQAVRIAGGAFGDLLLNPNAGNVGINTITPRGVFDIGGSVLANDAIYLSTNTNNGNQRRVYMPGNIIMSPWNGTEVSFLDARRESPGINSHSSLQIRTMVSGQITNALWISRLGHLVINGTETPAPASLEINQLNERGILLRNSGNTWEFVNAPTSFNLVFSYNNGDRAFVNNTNGSWNTFSDIRLKKDITAAETVLQKLMALKAMRYRYKNEHEQSKSLGFMAQEVSPLFPELVGKTKDKNGNEILGLNYAGFSVIAIKAIQEQQLMIEQLQKELAELKKLIK